MVSVSVISHVIQLGCEFSHFWTGFGHERNASERKLMARKNLIVSQRCFWRWFEFYSGTLIMEPIPTWWMISHIEFNWLLDISQNRTKNITLDHYCHQFLLLGLKWMSDLDVNMGHTDFIWKSPIQRVSKEMCSHLLRLYVFVSWWHALNNKNLFAFSQQVKLHQKERSMLKFEAHRRDRTLSSYILYHIFDCILDKVMR